MTDAHDFAKAIDRAQRHVVMQAHPMHGPVSIDDQDGPVISVGEPINVRQGPPPDDGDGGDHAASLIAYAITIAIAITVCIALFGGK